MFIPNVCGEEQACQGKLIRIFGILRILTNSPWCGVMKAGLSGSSTYGAVFSGVRNEYLNP